MSPWKLYTIHPPGHDRPGKRLVRLIQPEEEGYADTPCKYILPGGGGKVGIGLVEPDHSRALEQKYIHPGTGVKWAWEEACIEIYNWKDLYNIRNLPGACYLLMNNLDENTDYYAEYNDGDGWEYIPRLDGFLNGQGYSIYDLKMNRQEELGIGFMLNNWGEIYDIGFLDANIKTGGYAGIICANNYGKIKRAAVTGALEAFFYVEGFAFAGPVAGGIARWNLGLIENSYSQVDVTTDQDDYARGGLIAVNRKTATRIGTIINCYSTGQVLPLGGEKGGGLIGESEEDSVITHAYWDTETSGWNTSDGGEGKTTAQMQDIETFSEWDIEELAEHENEIWYIDNGSDYPRLWFEKPEEES